MDFGACVPAAPATWVRLRRDGKAHREKARVRAGGRNRPTMTPGLLEKSRQAIGIEWVEVEGGVSVNPAVHGDVRRNHWSIANHRLDTGQVKALCSAWADNGLRRAVEQPKLLDRNAPRWNRPRPRHCEIVVATSAKRQPGLAMSTKAGASGILRWTFTQASINVK